MKEGQSNLALFLWYSKINMKCITCGRKRTLKIGGNLDVSENTWECEECCHFEYLKWEAKRIKEELKKMGFRAEL